jgi:spermidine/putrescine transport system substrate-binding protein
MRRSRKYLTMLGGAACALLLAACGGSGGDTTVAEAPTAAELEEPATGTLRAFAYGDTVTDEMLDPFREANPDLDLQVATFNSNKAAAAKLAGGFEADVVEACTDEMSPLTARGLLSTVDETAIEGFDTLAFADSPEIRDEEGGVLFVPASSGPYGVIVNTEEVTEPVTSYNDLFDDAYAGRAALEATPLSSIGAAALALGYEDPFALTPDEIEEVKQFLLEKRDNFRSFAESDSDMVNLFKSGEVVIADGGRGTTEAMIDDGLPVEWIAPDEGATSWVCGWAITSDVENLDAAYKLIDYYASAEAQALSAEAGFVAMNPEALDLLPKELIETADPASLEGAIALTEPENAELYERAWQEVAAG